jgi:hypothetical protein
MGEIAPEFAGVLVKIANPYIFNTRPYASSTASFIISDKVFHVIEGIELKHRITFL